MVSTLPAQKESGIPWAPKLPTNWRSEPLRAVLQSRGEYNRGPKTQQILSVLKDVGVVPYEERGEGGNKKSLNIEQYKVIHPGDIVLNRMNAIFGSLGLSAHLGASSIEYYVLKPKDSTVDTRYYAHLFSTRLFQQSLLGIGRGILAHRMRIPFVELKQLLLPVPPPDVQKAIANFLDRKTAAIDALIERKEMLLDLLAEKRLALIHDTSQGCDEARLSEILIQVKRPIRREPDRVYLPAGILAYGKGVFLKEPKEGKELGDSDFFLIREGDLILSGIFAWEGAVAIARAEADGAIISHRFPMFRSRPDYDINYVLAYLQSHRGRFLLSENSRGAAGRNRPLSLSTLLKETIPIPSLEDQVQIGKLVKKEEAIRKSQMRFRELLDEYRQSLITAAVTGQLEIPAEDYE